MINPLQDLLPASFRGVSFFVHYEERQGGRKVQVFEYPLTKRRDIQDMGSRHPIYTLQCVVIGEDWLKKATELRRVCETESAGLLVIPSFGTFMAVCTSLKERVSDTAHGIVLFDLVFSVQKTRDVNIGESTETINSAGAKAIAGITISFSKAWTTPINKDNKAVAKSDFSQMMISLSEAIPGVEKATSGFMDKLNAIVGDVDKLTKALLREGVLGTVMNSLPADGSVFGSIKKLWTFGNNLSRTLPYLLDDITTLTNMGIRNLLLGPYGIPLWLKNTKSRKQRSEIRVATVALTRSFGVITALDQAAKANYTTVSDIDTRIADIEEAFTNVVYDPNLNLSSMVISALEQQKAVVYKVLDEKRERAYKVKTINLPNSTTAPLLAYQLYYEQIAKTNQISDFYSLSDFIGNLNKTQRRDKLVGTTTVLEVDGA